MQKINKEQALALVNDAAALLDAASRENPFTSQAWVTHFLQHIATADWRILALQTTAPELLMLLYHESGKSHALQALTNYYSSLFTPIAPPAEGAADGAAKIVRQIDAVRPQVATVTLAPLDSDAADTAALAEAFAKNGWYVRQYSCFGNWYLPCDGLTFADYMAARDSRTRNTWKRKSKKFANPDNPDGLRLEIVTAPAAVDAAMDAYDRIYANSWKKPEPYPEFVRGWARLCAERGTLRLGLAWKDDIPIAAQFWFTEHRRAFIYKLAYDEEHKKWSAGTVLSAKLFELSLEQDKVIEIDYLTGDDPYKQAWMSHRRERVGLLACNQRSLRGLAVSLKERAGEWRHRLRSSVQDNNN